ncbi:hypothetical protein PVK06_015088 [Gossypium arboreum]|uniref:Uncharacterized protein n=1 Tax=Gossypium arboreum TaxID=29729 RepID=A0ABR0PX76_GOSAR|nr:hypothetical protein PVK06_015088 [Gossypium arboreum]
MGATLKVNGEVFSIGRINQANAGFHSGVADLGFANGVPAVVLSDQMAKAALP